MREVVLSAIALILLSITPSFAGEYNLDMKSKDPIQLDITMRFNSIPAAMAAQIMYYLEQAYGNTGNVQKACILKAKVSDVDSDEGITLYWGYDEHNTVTQNCYENESQAKELCKEGYVTTGNYYCCVF